MQSPLKINAITLRGFGSYLHGARLEVRPITILCGKNGSGKSTWFKALNAISNAYHGDKLPLWGFSTDDGDASNIKETNARVLCGSDSDPELEKLAKSKATLQFGNFGTIGLEFEATEDIEFHKGSNEFADPYFLPQAFLWLGKCKKGTRFRLRFSDPVPFAPDKIWPYLDIQTELQINDGHTIRFTRNKNDFYDILCSESFLPGKGENGVKQCKIGCDLDAKKLDVKKDEDPSDSDAALAFGKHAVKRIKQLLQIISDGYFYISAIRLPYNLDESEIVSVEDPQLVFNPRHVGIQGENAWSFLHDYDFNEMLPTFGSDFEGYVSFWLQKLTGNSLQPNRGHYLDRIENPFFASNGQRPKQMSSGFHQLLPIIVQIGIMRRYEVASIENPEVHLHPSLQLETMEYFINQAQSGRNILIETHSDLVVRRVLRAILEETISQKDVRIYFVDTIPDKELWAHSSLQLLQTNEQGRIENWPEGFMDDDMKENQRLMNIMYGFPYKEEEE